MSTLNIAHRGASADFPENTLRAFIAAADAGADMCELDVQATHDGAVIVLHDDTVDRTTDGHGAVAEMTLDEVGRLDAGIKCGAQFRGERIPTLEQVFEATRSRVALNIEIKEGAVEPAVCELIRRFDARSSSMVSSFEWRALQHVRMIDPEIRIGLLAEEKPPALLRAAEKMQAYAVNPRFDLVSREFCDEAHRRDLAVLAWTVDVPELMRYMIEAGVDGIMTNHPARLAAILRGE